MELSTTKTQLNRDQINLIEYPPGTQNYTLPKSLLLTRGFSKVQANEEILNETRNQIETNLRKNQQQQQQQQHDSPSLQITELSDYSFILPDLFKYPNEFRDFLHNDLIEVSVQYSLSESNHLNWWSSNQFENVCRSLYPMVTSGDGNCLLHAASLGMWGLHDRYLILRKALHSTLENIKPNSPLWRRWKWEQMIQNKKYGLVLNDDEWNKEWSSLLRLSSYQPRVQQTSFNKKHSSTVIKSTSLGNLSKTMSTSSVNINDNQDGVYFESLEEFHVFVLAQIIQRPIIIVADKYLHDANGEPLAPIPFGGIYLPVECDLNKCHKYPLVLAYDAAHFSALVLMEDERLLNENNDDLDNNNNIEPPYSIVPITYSNLELLDVHFAYDPGENYDWSKFQVQDDTSIEQLNRDDKLYLLQKYLDLVKIQLTDLNHVYITHVNVEQKKTKVAKKQHQQQQQALVSNSSSEETKTKSGICGSKLKKFFNLFKTTNSNESSSSIINESKGKLNKLPSSSPTKRVQKFKSWNTLYDKLHPETCILAACLSIKKPPKYAKIIENYIDLAKEKFSLFKREQKIQQFQQQQIKQKQDSTIILKCSNSNCTNQIDNRFDKNYCRNCSLNY